MNIKLLPEVEALVTTLTSEHAYTPDEIISIGLTLATVLLREKGLGNRVVVVDVNDLEVAEFKEPEPRAIREVAERYISSLFPETTEISPLP